jgi:hypothetical protein
MLVWCAYLFCRTGYYDRPELRLGVPILGAFLPQDIFYSISSDVLSPFFFAASLCVLLAWYRSEHPRAALGAVIGLLVALTFLAKFTNIALPVIFGVAIFFKTRRGIHDGRGPDALLAASVALLTASLPVAICLGRNYVLLGDATGTQAKIEQLGWSWRPLVSILDHPVFTPAGFWTFWDGLMRTFWRGEFVWHLKPIANPFVDAFYTTSSTAFLIAAAVAQLLRMRRDANERAASPGSLSAVTAMVWASVTLSVICLVALSISFEYGTSFFPSNAHPYFTSGRLIAGALIPFLVLYVEGLTFLGQRLSRVRAPLVCPDS